jgi:polysaccharide biosynthesis/export protein
VPVRPDGMISLPLLNDVPATGRTPMQLREELTARLQTYMPSVEVSVVVLEVNSFQVAVIGKVQRPNRYRLRKPTTVLEVLAEAGGFVEFANTEDIVVMRQQPIQIPGRPNARAYKRLRFNYKRVISLGGQTENIALEPGDIVVVP